MTEELLNQYPILTYFQAAHLPAELRVVSEQFQALAVAMATALKPSAETSTCLRKLLEAKDCAVRAVL